ncbi:hypothetical protein EP04_01755 [Listeria monocytogenes]|nr:hypothetical protein [Listeria monocytogenes]
MINRNGLSIKTNILKHKKVVLCITLVILISIIVYISYNILNNSKIELNKNYAKGYYLVYEGKIDDDLKVTLKYDSKSEKISVHENEFILPIKRKTVEKTYTIIADDKEKKVIVPAQKKLISYEKLRDQFNYINLTEDNLSIELPDNINEDEEIIPGFNISSDGSEVMSIKLSYSASDLMNDHSMDDYDDFTYSILVIMSSLNQIDSFNEVLLDALQESQDEKKEVKVSIDSTTYKFHTIGTKFTEPVTILEIFPK